MIDYKSSAPPRAKTPDGCAVYCSFDKIVPIRELKPNPDNPNTHGDSQIKLLGGIIESTGWRAPITVSKRSGLIVKGHGRRVAAIHKGLQYAPVEYQDYATDVEERADLLADNRIAELAEMDEGKLADMIKDIRGEISTELAGYTDKDIENLLGDVKPDTVDDGADTEEKEFPAVSRPGDLWHLGKHRLLCGSATHEADVSRLMGSERANLIHTDPPYGVSYVDISGRFRIVKNDHMARDELLQKLLIPAFKNMVKYSADNAAFYIWYAVTNVRDFMDAMDAVGIEWTQRIIWAKNNFVISHNDYEWDNEPCFYGRKSGGKKPPFYGGRAQTTTWKVTTRGRDSMATVLTGGVLLTDGVGAKLYITDKKPKGKKCRTIRLGGGRSIYLSMPSTNTTTWTVDKDPHIDHPNQKPLELPARAIRNSTKEGDLVMDLFGGSGSTLLAAEMENRRCYCTELDPKYCDLIIKRYTDATGGDAPWAERDGKKVTLKEAMEPEGGRTKEK